MFDRAEMIEEKKNDSGSDASPPFPFSASVSKILFEVNNGSSSSLLIDKDIGFDSSRALEEESPIQNQRNVRFSGMEFMDQSQDDSILSDVEAIRARIAQLSMELSAEKALRKRKEKNLIKLAKELNKRATDAGTKEARLVEMTNQVNDLEAKLRETRNDNAKDLASFRVACHEKEMKVSELDSKVSDVCKQLLEARLEADLLRTKLAANYMSQYPNKADKIKQHALEGREYTVSALQTEVLSHRKASVSLSTVFAFSSLILAIMTVACPVFFSGSAQFFDSICCPVMPGSIVSLNSGEHQAPWWAPASVKPEAFSFICGDRPRTELSWSGKTLIIRKLSSTEKPSVAWEGRAPFGAKVESNELIMKLRWGEKIIKAPWST